MALAGEDRGDGIIDVDQVEPGVGVAVQHQPGTERGNSRDEPAGAIDSGQAQDVCLGNPSSQELLGFEAYSAIFGFGMTFGRLVNPFPGVLSIDAGARNVQKPADFSGNMIQDLLEPADVDFAHRLFRIAIEADSIESRLDYGEFGE